MPKLKWGAMIVLTGLLAVIAYSNLSGRPAETSRAAAAEVTENTVPVNPGASQEQLQATYERGKLDAAQTSGDAFQKGREAGYQEGYQKGRDEGYQAGQSDGRNEGGAAGFQQGAVAGYAQGHEHGFAQGQARGFEAGYEQGLRAARDGQ